MATRNSPVRDGLRQPMMRRSNASTSEIDRFRALYLEFGKSRPFSKLDIPESDTKEDTPALLLKRIFDNFSYINSKIPTCLEKNTSLFLKKLHHFNDSLEKILSRENDVNYDTIFSLGKEFRMYLDSIVSQNLSDDIRSRVINI